MPDLHPPRIPMPYTETEVHDALQRLALEGYAALTVRQQNIIDSLFAIC